MRRPVLYLFLLVFTVSAVVLAAQKEKSSPEPVIVVSPKHESSAGKSASLSRAGAGTSSPGPQAVSPGSLCDLAIAASSFNAYGFYAPGTGVALPDETWTFDHGAPDIREGWRAVDLTENSFTAFQRIDAAIWASHFNIPPPPLIAGLGSMWLGFHRDEANAACYTGGLGYGNNWKQRVISPPYNNNAATPVTLSFSYWSNTEAGFDYDI